MRPLEQPEQDSPVFNPSTEFFDSSELRPALRMPLPNTTTIEQTVGFVTGIWGQAGVQQLNTEHTWAFDGQLR